MINEINKDLDIYDKAVKEVRSSIRLRSLLKAVLKWGNYVNYGINDNEDLVALGFTLSSVLKLSEFKSSIDSKITSLHYITVTLCMYLPNLNMNLLENDLLSVLTASKMSSESIDIIFSSLEKEITYIKGQLKTNYEEKFKEKMVSLLEDSEQKYNTAQKQYEQTKKDVKELGIYLGEDMPKNGNLENIFIILSSIVDSFTKCYKDILANPKKFSIMLNEESLLDDYYNVFCKGKKRPIIKMNSISTNSDTKEDDMIKNKSIPDIKIKINKSKSVSVKKNDHGKSTMFQLRNQLMQDIQNRSILKKSLVFPNTSENESSSIQPSQQNGVDNSIAKKEAEQNIKKEEELKSDNGIKIKEVQTLNDESKNVNVNNTMNDVVTVENKSDEKQNKDIKVEDIKNT